MGLSFTFFEELFFNVKNKIKKPDVNNEIEMKITTIIFFIFFIDFIIKKL
jgi:hypothetical protein